MLALVPQEGPSQDSTLTGPALASPGSAGASGFAIRWVFPATDGIATILKSGTTLIGRDPDCEGNLPSASVSRRHAEIHWTLAAVPMVRDVDSRNGVFLNGRRVSQAPLRAGDVLRLGDWIGILVALPPGGLPPWSFHELTRGYWGGPLMQSRLQPARMAAASELSVIVQGATGSGKEGAARAIHEWSGRSGPFIAVNCASIPETLAEAELFGYRKGAFTHADRAAEGFLRAAHEGTLFLDEVSELPLSIQPKLLRALERREVVPLGEAKPIPIDIKLVTATQEPLRRAAGAKRFRSDLLARLEGLVILLPSLRERIEELPFLLAKMLEDVGPTSSPPRLDPLLVERLCVYKWPFNVRELAQFVRRVAALHPEAEILDHSVLASSTEASISEATESAPSTAGSKVKGASVNPAATAAADEVPAPAELNAAELEERVRITRTLAECVGNQSEAAKRLGISRTTLIERLKRLRVPRPRSRY